MAKKYNLCDIELQDFGDEGILSGYEVNNKIQFTNLPVSYLSMLPQRHVQIYLVHILL